MKVTVVGGGAAGLSSAIVLRTLLDAEVTILERAKEGESPGLGVALLPFAMDELSRLVKQPYRIGQRNPLGMLISREAMGPHAGSFFPISRVVRVFAGMSNSSELAQDSRMQDTQYWGVRRAALLNMLRGSAQAIGVRIEYDCDVSEARIRQECASADLVVGADGAGSAVRNQFADAFRPVSEDAKSRYAWLELEGHLDYFLFAYIYIAGKGLIRVTAYTHGTNESSAIITASMGLTPFFDEAGMLDADGTISAQGLDFINGLFARVLGGRKLTGKSRWRRFRATQTRQGATGNVALVGDAHTTLHYETGWGTSMAMQGSSILGQALLKGATLQDGLTFYSERSTEIAKGAIAATLKSMRQVDGQAAKFYQHGPAKFLTLRTA